MAESIPAPRSGVRAVAQGASPGFDFYAQDEPRSGGSASTFRPAGAVTSTNIKPQCLRAGLFSRAASRLWATVSDALARFLCRFAVLAHQLQSGPFQILEDFCQCGDNFKKIVNDPVMRDLENRRLRVFIDGNDASRCLHSHQMLDRSRNADSDI